MLRLLTACTLLAAIATLSAADPKPTAGQLVGTWKLDQLIYGKKAVSYFTFAKDGKLAILIEADGKKTNNSATWKLDGGRLELAYVTPGETPRVDLLEIKSLTATELTMVDDRKQEAIWKRVTADKK